MLGERLREAQEELAEAELPSTEARHEGQIASEVLAERRRSELLALRLSPPSYISEELGERPQVPHRAQEWDQAALRIEDFRRTHGITSREHALGREGEVSTNSASHRAAQEALRNTQRRLNLQRQLDRSMQRGREMDHGFDLGIG